GIGGRNGNTSNFHTPLMRFLTIMQKTVGKSPPLPLPVPYRDLARRESHALIDHLRHLLDRGRLAINPQQRLCPRLSEEDPAIVFEDQLRPVERRDIHDLVSGEAVRRILSQVADQLLPRFDGQVQVATFEMEFAELAPDVAHDL